jgi:hypothetical protein
MHSRWWRVRTGTQRHCHCGDHRRKRVALMRRETRRDNDQMPNDRIQASHAMEQMVSDRVGFPPLLLLSFCYYGRGRVMSTPRLRYSVHRYFPVRRYPRLFRLLNRTRHHRRTATHCQSHHQPPRNLTSRSTRGKKRDSKLHTRVMENDDRGKRHSSRVSFLKSSKHQERQVIVG